MKNNMNLTNYYYQFQHRQKFVDDIVEYGKSHTPEMLFKRDDANKKRWQTKKVCH